MAVPAAGYSSSCRRNSSEVEPGDDCAEGYARRVPAGDSGRLGLLPNCYNWGVDAITENTTAIREISFGAGDFRKSDSRALLHV